MPEQTAPFDLSTLVEQAIVHQPGRNGTGKPAPPDVGGCPPLPPLARLDPALADGASRWLDDYIAFSRHWSPRAYDGFHEAVGLWVLSTAAAGRVMVHFGGERFTSLYILLCARTSLHTKSTTAEIGAQALKAAELDWLLLGDSMTPQKFIRELAAHLPDDYDSLPPALQERVRARLALSGQRGWFYEEFGQQIAAMMRLNGIMADFRGLLRRLDDHHEVYAYGTISRGDDTVERPYLALLANLTPAELRFYARPGGALWQDGFYARFAFVAPPRHDGGKRGKFPPGERTIPPHLVEPLVAWHQRLGMPDIRIVAATDGEGKPTGSRRVERDEFAPAVCAFGPGVVDAYYAYYDGLLDIVEQSQSTDLDGNYARLAEKALRIATLLASLEGGDLIELRHWARSQQIAERWRADLHHLMAALGDSEPTRSEQQEDQVWQRLCVLAANGQAPTAREIGQGIRGMTTQDVERVLGPLARSGEVAVESVGRTQRYRPVEV